ncbi:hypothetical protein WJX84_007747 [Apatococcus fuscideae]|uniref:Uncharacterized protein n=1 Tax=Apatococcus fuscideae TaxID=2026836 RepID=A0AAW1TKT5_9CHLO
MATAVVGELQGQIATLRTELYAVRRGLWEAQQARDQVSVERDAFRQRISGLEVEAEQLQSRADQAEDAQRLMSALQPELDQLRGEVAQRRDAQQETAKASQELEEAKATAEKECLRLRRARDELAASVLAAEQRASDAETDLLRSEEETAALHAELRMLQEQAASQEAARDDKLEAGTSSLKAAEEQTAALATKLAAAKDENDHSQKQCQALQTDVAGLQEALNAERMKGKGSGSREKSEQMAASSKAAQAALQSLEVQVARLRVSRDKLLAEVDSLSAELERLGLENTALLQGTGDLREASQKWELQTMEGLEQNQKLMDLLSESAAWPAPATGPDQDGQKAQLLQAEASSMQQDSHQDLGAQLLQAHSRTAELELHVRALCCELLRAHSTSGAVQRAMVPALSGIEAQLMDLTRLESLPA